MNRYNLNFDLINYEVIEINNWKYYYYDYNFNNVSKLHITISKQFSKHLSIYSGPTINVSVSNQKDSEGTLLGLPTMPWSVYSVKKYNYRTDFYPGFRIGIRI